MRARDLSCWTRRRFLGGSASLIALGSAATAQQDGERPPPPPAGIRVLNPAGRVPLSLIIDDSTCLVNLNKFAIPQFAEAFPDGRYDHYNWREWPDEIPDAFVRRFGEWSAEHHIRGKYSVVPFPACVGRVDRTLPGWTQRQLRDSLSLVRDLMMPRWDIHPEMVTHTRVIDLSTGHPHPEFSTRFMENWDWTTGRSADEIGAYMAYGLRILKDAGLSCEGVTTPGGFGNRARPQLAEAAFQSCREVFGAEIPHYFRDLFSEGDQSVAPRVQNARGLESDDPRCVVSLIGCTGDWTGGWDNSLPVGSDRFISEDGRSGRLVEVISRGEPAIIVCHWTGIHFNGRELGFQILQEVARRLRQHHPQARWMKLSEIARSWAARELTRLSRGPDGSWDFHAPYACPEFTLEIEQASGVPHLGGVPLQETSGFLSAGRWQRHGALTTVCLDLPKGRSRLTWA